MGPIHPVWGHLVTFGKAGMLQPEDYLAAIDLDEMMIGMLYITARPGNNTNRPTKGGYQQGPPIGSQREIAKI